MHMREEGVLKQKDFSLSSPNEERAGVRSFDFIAVLLQTPHPDLLPARAGRRKLPSSA